YVSGRVLGGRRGRPDGKDVGKLVQVVLLKKGHNLVPPTRRLVLITQRRSAGVVSRSGIPPSSLGRKNPVTIVQIVHAQTNRFEFVGAGCTMGGLAALLAGGKQKGN